jgi:SAM-dependent MidA family methyltransferase
MNPLHRKLARLCAANGPMTLGEYMHACLADPEHGYYATRDSIAATDGTSATAGDFITAPEVSQMFGELIGIWCVDTWHKLGRPSPFCLAELGPGRGRMMQDMLRAASLDPQFLQAARIALVETSEKLRAVQASALKPLGCNICWVNSIDDLPDMPALIVANEFLDAIPFRQFVRQGGLWREVGVNVGDDGISMTALATTIHPSLLPEGEEDEPEGSVFEYAPAREALAQTLAQRISAHQGAILLIDYGHFKSGFGDTFQAVRNHSSAEPFSAPGECDLTSHVDFERIAGALTKGCDCTVHSASQGDFLLNLGLLERAGALGAPHPEAVRARIRSEVERLAAPSQMGELFKVVAVSCPDLAMAGFANPR